MTVMLVGDAVDANGAEGKSLEAHGHLRANYILCAQMRSYEAAGVYSNRQERCSPMRRHFEIPKWGIHTVLWANNGDDDEEDEDAEEEKREDEREGEGEEKEEPLWTC
jgi:hypothetical protein